MAVPSDVLERILELSLKMAENRVLPPLLTYALDVAIELFKAERGYLIFIDSKGELEFRVSRYMNKSDIPKPQISQSILRPVIYEGQPILISDAVADPILNRAESVRIQKVRSVMCVPLMTSSVVIGALYLDHRIERDVFGPTELKFLQLFANQAAVSIANAILNDELEARIAQGNAELEEINQRLLEMRLEQERAKMLASFIQDASHQFRTPLSIIQNNLYLLGRKIEDDSLSGYLLGIRQQTETMADLVQSLVLMARLDSEVLDKKTRFEPALVVESLLGKMSEFWAQKDQMLQTDLRSVPLIFGDLDLLEEALSELLWNAHQYTPARGVVRLMLYARGAEVLYEVQDSGVGIAEEILPFIFQRFYRGDKAGTTRGLGLGLSIAQKIAELHGGRIEVESRLGQGSVFRLVLPGGGA
jgi:signal transduction histidine kinase